MKTLIWLWVTAAGLSIGFCQNREIDSLRELLNNSESNDLPEVNSRLGWAFYNQSIFDSAVSHYKRALARRYENPNLSWLGNVHFGLGASYAALGQADSSAVYYERALGYFLSVGDEDNIATTNTNLSIVYKNLGLYEEALELSYNAAKILETRDASEPLARCYNTLAQILTKIENYNEAIKYYHEAIRLFAKFNVAYQARAYNNLGELFILIHQYDSARTNLLLAADIKRQLNDTKGVGRTLSNLGKVSMLTGDLPRSEQQLKESLALQGQLDDPVGMIEVLNNLGEFYLVSQRYKQSDQSLTEAARIIRRAGSPEYLRQNLELQVRLARQRKDYANGMFLLGQLLDIKDSLLNEEKSKSLQAMQIRYETKKKEQQIALFRQREEFNQVKLKNSRIVIGSLAAGLALAATIGLLIYINLRNARASRERIELLLAETRHRIKNNLQTLASIFHLQTRHYTDRDMVLEARSSESRVHTMSLLNEKFYLAEPGNTVHTRAYITDLVHKLVDIYGVRTTNPSVSIEVEDIELDVDKALALSLIIQELICNAFKYAFDQEPEPVLSVAISSRDDQVMASIHDNGIGLSNGSTKTSQGFDLVEALVAQLDGKMQVRNDGGTTFTIQFPLTPLWKKRLFS